MCRQSAGIPTLCNTLIINAVQAKSAECRQNQQIQSLGGMQVKTLPQNASSRRKLKTLALMGATRLASGKDAAII